ncbi:MULTISPECIES: hypothetical protein [unclassified Streptomyces]|uniref:hypothetical protein n=1 Tax=unclassified Streptomyces TaxID=2593676 RepID=UPI001370AB82|nr:MULTISPECIES: hypothetical protein [unclassified Streptomyces]NEA04830.1 hypothetical protein [Streptomyces sp. SID10116]MYY83066.1 hypothetical protein [Streptomyces sp. SID335]MYZ14417.1 hypothetical protein [Streptomyces sp. SID337]NDZ91998.1 hypothetical protein [Streptomyces sp. SID10115]NEB42930.1 hypothetical protein [Streptomyces sp. SID339]
MRAIRVASAALLTASALALSAPAASAAAVGEENVTAFGFSISPKTVAAGGQVTLSVDGCDGDTKVTSGVFDDTTIPKGQKSATAQVFWDAKPGAMYEVTFTCNGSNPGSDKTDLTIATGRPDNNSHHNQHNQHNKGVKAGIGGSFGGLDLHEIALGSALIIGTLGTAYYKARRRTGEDNS